MKISGALVLILVLLVATSAFGIEKKAYLFRDDFGIESLSECVLNYYYYIPCPTYAWFWDLRGLEQGDIVGAWFELGDVSMGGFDACEPLNCHVLEEIRVLDFAGYGSPSLYPSLVVLGIYCSDDNGCPIGPLLWESATLDLAFGWNYIPVDPPLTICGCAVDPGPPPSMPRILVTGTTMSSQSDNPWWGLDDISSSVMAGCEMHDTGCMPTLYPRPHTSHYTGMHSGYYGKNFEYCPPVWFKDGRDTTPDGTQYGFIELAWRISVTCSGPSSVQSTTWAGIKSMYR